MILYHKELGFPRGTTAAIAQLQRVLPDKVRGTAHYEDRRNEKGLPAFVTRDWFQSAIVIETQVVKGRIERILFRGALNEWRDLCVVLDTRIGRVVTGWTNNRRDWHRLDSERSARYTRVTGGE